VTGERQIDVNGVGLCTESFGDLADPPILLVMGLGGSMLWWPDEFCRLLAEPGRFVIRYDQRDTGRSTTYEPGHPGYSGGDLLADKVALLHVYGLPAAHLVGVSSGGALVRLLALDLPSHVLSLVLISTSPAVPGHRTLPPPSAAFAEFARSTTVDWSDTGSVIDYLVAYARVLAGEQRRFDDAEARDFVRRDSSAPATSQPCRTTTCSTTTPGHASRSRRSKLPRSSSTAPPTRCSGSRTAKRSPPRSRTHGCSRSKEPATASSEPTGTRSPRRSQATPPPRCKLRRSGPREDDPERPESVDASGPRSASLSNPGRPSRSTR